jgi:hypothetical protein
MTLTGEIAAQLRGEAREDLLIAALEGSPLTGWLQGQQPTWHWENTPRWEIVGSGSVEFTQAVFQPDWADQQRPSFIARCGLATGFAEVDAYGHGHSGAVQLGVDLMLNLVDLDSDRRPDPVDHRSDPAPAPAALSLDEVAEILLQLLHVPCLAITLANQLLPAGEYDSGEVGAWVSINGVQLERVLDFRGFRRLQDSYDVPDHPQISAWPFPDAPGHPDPSGNFVADLLEGMLERCGYRGVGQRFDGLRQASGS